MMKKTKRGKIVARNAKQNRRRMSEEERIKLAVDVATRYYRHKQTQEQIKRALGFKHTSSVSRLLSFAEQNGIVVVLIDPEAGERPIRNRQLEIELAVTFDLDNCIVVENVGYEGNFEWKKDEKLHRVLGKALGEELRCRIRPGDHIGVLGGRATHYTAVALSNPREPALKHKGVAISSLAGSVTTTASGANIPVDANNVAYQFGRAFKQAKVKPLQVPVGLPTKQIKENFLQGPGEPISPEKWKKDQTLVPNIVILGIGALDYKNGHHRFLQIEDHELHPIKQSLRVLIKAMQNLNFCAVGDIGYRLFSITPFNRSIPKHLKETIDNAIDELNEKIIALDRDQLRMVDKVIAVAGGPVKFDAIYQFLKDNDPEPLIHELCTDKYTAEALIKREKRWET